MIIRRIEGRRDILRKRVAAYARVSTDFDEQQESFDRQIDYYSAFIRQNPEWDLVQVYSDSGKSGTSARKRPGFQKMLTDARAKKIDIILVKSISRFARNVADAQRYVHELKAYEVEVLFEREALSSFDPSAEFVFSVLAAVAQEESRSISENVKWSYRKKAEKGIRRMGENRALGYDADNEGNLIPNGDAWIVKQIFAEYAGGQHLARIVQRLNEVGAKRLRSERPFNIPSVLSIVGNELYAGDRRLQKHAPLDYLTKRPDPTVEYTSYYVTNAHEPIIDRETWERAQARLDKEHSKKQQGIYAITTSHFLYGRIFCAICGAPYKRRTFIYQKRISYKAWNCAQRQKGKKGNGCKNIIVPEKDLLKTISDVLGWPWESDEAFDSESFLSNVQRVKVGIEFVEIECLGAKSVFGRLEGVPNSVEIEEGDSAEMV